MLGKLLNNKYYLALISLVVGCAIGAIFYPSKTITTEERAKYQREIENTRAFASDRIQALMEEKDEIEGRYIEYKLESERKMTSLRTENTELKQKTKETIVKIVRPDGTITEKTVRTSDTQVVSQIVTDIKQEFTEKVTSIENRWKQVHERRVKNIQEKYREEIAEKDRIISEHSKKKTVKVNERKFGVSLGYTRNDTYFSSITYSVFGPFFLDMHLEADSAFKDSNAGVGVGFSF